MVKFFMTIVSTRNKRSKPLAASGNPDGINPKTGTAIRLSKSTGVEYYYFAKDYMNYFIRVALPYDIEIQNFLKTDNIFLYFITLLFFITLISLIYISDRFGKAISDWKILSFRPTITTLITTIFISRIRNWERSVKKIIHNYQLLEESNKQINVEQEKLLRHFTTPTRNCHLLR